MTHPEAQKKGQDISIAEKCTVCIVKLSTDELITDDYDSKKESETDYKTENVVATFSIQHG